jgi:hypothetical protein
MNQPSKLGKLLQTDCLRRLDRPSDIPLNFLEDLGQQLGVKFVEPLQHSAETLDDDDQSPTLDK